MVAGRDPASGWSMEVARIRTIKPEFFTNEKLSELPASTHLLAAALLCYADDEGYFNANTKLIRSACCPLRDATVSIPESLRSLEEIGYIERGKCTGDGRDYARIVNFGIHQSINKAKQSKIKTYDIIWPSSGITPVAVPGGMEQGTGNGMEQGKEVGAADAASDSQSTQAATRAEDVPLPASLDSPSFLAVRDAWFVQRRRKRLSLRPEYVVRQYERLAAIGPDRAAACLRATIDNDYDGIFPEKFGSSHGKSERTQAGIVYSG